MVESVPGFRALRNGVIPVGKLQRRIEDDLAVRVGAGVRTAVDREAILACGRGYVRARAAVDLLDDRDRRKFDDLVRGHGDVLLARLRDEVAGLQAAVLRGAVALTRMGGELELVVDDRLTGSGEVDAEGDHPLAVRRPEAVSRGPVLDRDGRVVAGDVVDRAEGEVVVEEKARAVIAGEPHLHRGVGCHVGAREIEVEVDRVAFLVLGDVPRRVVPAR